MMYFLFYMAWISVGSTGNTITSQIKGPGFESRLNRFFASSLLLGLDFLHNPKARACTLEKQSLMFAPRISRLLKSGLNYMS